MPPQTQPSSPTSSSFLSKQTVASGFYYFAVLGALGGFVQHLLFPDSLVNDLIPVARTSNGEISPEFRFWGGYAMAASSFATFVSSVYGGVVMKSKVARQMTLLYTATMFFGFGTAWLFRGNITGKKDYLSQAITVYTFSGLFFAGFFASKDRE